MRLRNCVMLCATFVAAMAVLLMSGCARTDVYPDNAFNPDPGVRTIAIAPFIVDASVAGVEGQAFDSRSYVSGDGAKVYYSEEFAAAFADSIRRFPGIRVIGPDRVMRDWKAISTNPLDDPTGADARKIARSLRADAILIGEVVAWDSYTPRATIDWGIYYAKPASAGGGDVLDVERRGKAGGGEARRDLSKDPLYFEQLSLDYDDYLTRKRMGIYEDAVVEIEPYMSVSEAIQQEPFPRLVRFAAWCAMNNAYNAEGAGIQKWPRR